MPAAKQRWTTRVIAALASCQLIAASSVAGAEKGPPKSVSEAVARMRPMAPVKPWRPEETVDRSTLTRKVMAGYQGWFAAEGDGSGLGWKHYGLRGKLGPGHCTFDLWPDLSEMDEEERFDSPFVDDDGQPLPLFSSFVPKTVARHFFWMQQHGIDGVFLQRFVASLQTGPSVHHRNVVTRNVQRGANRFGRTWALMYDLTRPPDGEIYETVTSDWRNLVDRMGVLDDPAYLRHRGKPVLALWGVGFLGRGYSLGDTERLVEFFRSDDRYGDVTLLVGVPGPLITADMPEADRERVMRLIARADIVSPWTVGRYTDPEGAERYVKNNTGPEMRLAAEQGQDYLPVIFPGFSWHNQKLAFGQPERAKFNQVPRLKGRFLWNQAAALKRAGAEMLYVAMFDEIDEGTAIFKCVNDPPAGESPFLTYEGLPSDHYLWLTGEIGRRLRGEVRHRTMPTRPRASSVDRTVSVSPTAD